MKKYLLINLFFIFVGIHSFATTTYKVGASETYTKIVDAYNACIGADNYIVELQSDYDYNAETSNGTVTITLSTLANKDATNTVTIRPATGASFTFTSSGVYMFTLDNAKWVRIDGRQDGVGSSISLNMIAPTGCFNLIGTTNSIIKYCSMRGNPSLGVIKFSAVTNPATHLSGNENNRIDHCTIQSNTTTTAYLIYSIGSSGRSNSNNSISNCDLLNFHRSAVWLDNYTTTWSIDSNHVYQSTSFTGTLGDVRMIYIKTGDGYTLNGNFLGGQAPSCAGSAFKITNGSNNAFSAIYFDASSQGGVTNTINNNTIANINVTNATTSPGTDKIPFSLIHVGGKGNFIIGASGNGNTIGSTTGTGSIFYSYTGSAVYGCIFAAIRTKTIGTTTIGYNLIGSIKDSSVVTAATQYHFALIQVYTKASVLVTNNVLGNETADNVTTTSSVKRMCGIWDNNTTDSASVNHVFTSNTIQNLTVNNVASGLTSKLVGIYVRDIANMGIEISGNSISNLTVNATSLSGDASYSESTIEGIFVNDGNNSEWSVFGNSISNLNCIDNAGGIIHLVGIHLDPNSSTKANVYRNKVRTLTNASTNSDSDIVGFYCADSSNDTINLFNNIAILSDSKTASIGLFGILNVRTSSGHTNIYHNTIKLTGTFTSGTSSSATIQTSVDALSTYEVKNNIFQNNVSGGFGSHYAQNWSSVYTTPANILNNYNQAAIVANWGGIDKAANDDWKTAISSSSEVTGSIIISSTSGEPSSDAIVGSTGTPITSVTTDYDLNPRSATAPWIGAFELIIPLSFNLAQMKVKCVKSKTNNSQYGGTVTWTTLNETNNDYYTIEKSIDGFIWKVKDTIDGAGTIYQPTNYYYHDNFINPTPENEIVVYYRVNQTDFDGVVHSFDILSCKCEASDKIKIHPIPSNESIVINFGDQNNVPNRFQITDMFGHIIEDVIVSGDKANSTSYTLDISKYASGRYIIKINDWKMKEDGVFIKE